MYMLTLTYTHAYTLTLVPSLCATGISQRTLAFLFVSRSQGQYIMYLNTFNEMHEQQ